MSMGPREGRALHAMSIDDAYEVQRALASGPAGKTEVVTIDGLGPYLRKRIPLPLVDRRVWAAVAECANPRLPHVVATYETPDEFVVVCDFAPGDTVSEVVAAQGRLAVAQATRIALELCEAIEDLHRHGIAHCDVSPRNVLLAADGAHLIDLGIARPIGTEPSSESPALGTHGFAAPEQYGFAPIDERTDVYSMARLLGFLLTGLEPGDAYQTALADDAVAPAPLRAAIARGSAFEPSARYRTIGEFAQAIASETERSLPPARPAERVPPPKTPTIPDSPPGAPASTSRQSGKRHIAIVSVVAIVSVAALLVTFCLILNVFGPDAASRYSDIVEWAQGSLSLDRDDQPAGEQDAETEGASPHTSPSTPSANLPKSNSSFPAEDLVVVDQAWHLSGEFVSFAFALRNDNDELSVDFPAVDVVGRDAEGKVIFSSTEVLSVLNPGETMYFTSIANAGTTIPQTVDFLPVEPKAHNVRPDPSESSAFRVKNLSVREGSLGEAVFTGEVVREDGGGDTEDPSYIVIVVALRDAAGNLVDAVHTFANCPNPGATTTFEAAGFNVADYATFEAYAYPW